MRSRGLVVVLALILATLATVGVFLYSQGVKEDARQGGDLVTVVVSRDDIPANTDLSTLIRDGRFTTRDFPREALVEDPVVDLAQLQGRRNSVTIFAGEQIPVARVGSAVAGGAISIPEGHQAMTVALASDRLISGTLTGGDNVAIYATFTDVQLGGPTSEPNAPVSDATVVLVPEVEVLRVLRPTVAEVTGEAGADSGLTGTLQVILAFEPEEAQKFVFAFETGSLYMSLLRPDEGGTTLKPIGLAKIIAPNRGPQG